MLAYLPRPGFIINQEKFFQDFWLPFEIFTGVGAFQNEYSWNLKLRKAFPNANYLLSSEVEVQVLFLILGYLFAFGKKDSVFCVDACFNIIKFSYNKQFWIKLLPVQHDIRFMRLMQSVNFKQP